MPVLGGSWFVLVSVMTGCYKIVCGAFQLAHTSAQLQVAARIASIGIRE
jgi:hypothetical protein